MNRILSILIFLSISLLVLLASHFFLYVSFVSFFSITNPDTKAFLALWGIFGSVAFILASFFAHWRDNVFTRGFYVISASWLGFLTYLVLYSAIAWLLVLIWNAMGYANSGKVFWALVIFGSFITGVYGLWNAANPRLVNSTIHIKWLDERWNGKKIVHISDVHIGHVLRQDFLWNIVDKINYVRPEAVFITGDFFDGMDGNLEHLSEPLDDIDSKHGIYYVDGNHETYLGTSRSLAAIGETRAKILNDSMEVIDGLQIAGVSYPDLHEKKKDVFSTLRRVRWFDFAKPYILLFHQPFRLRNDGEFWSGLFLAGHTHNGQLYPFNFIVRAIFGAFSCGLAKVGDLNVYVSSGVGTWWPPMRVWTVPEIAVLKLLKA